MWKILLPHLPHPNSCSFAHNGQQFLYSASFQIFFLQIKLVYIQFYPPRSYTKKHSQKHLEKETN